jgi:AAA15 family ATPase/GTPase
MNEQRMTLQSVRVRNFKAIVDSRTVRFGPLTAFIGYNGRGKSSLIEALETYQAIIVDGLDVAMQRWLGIEHVRQLGAESEERAGKALNELAFDLSGRTATSPSAPTPIATCNQGGRY